MTTYITALNALLIILIAIIWRGYKIISKNKIAKNQIIYERDYWKDEYFSNQDALDQSREERDKLIAKADAWRNEVINLHNQIARLKGELKEA